MPSPEARTTVLSHRFRALFDAEVLYICRALRRLGVREADLKDVGQELLLAVHAHLDTYDDSRPLRPWLFGFVLRYASNYRRLADYGRARARVDVEPNSLVDKGPGHARYEARDTVLRGLESLEYEQRVVLVMHDLEGFDALEIADKLSVPLNTVYSCLRLARARFRSTVLETSAGGMS